MCYQSSKGEHLQKKNALTPTYNFDLNFDVDHNEKLHLWTVCTGALMSAGSMSLDWKARELTRVFFHPHTGKL